MRKLKKTAALLLSVCMGMATMTGCSEKEPSVSLSTGKLLEGDLTKKVFMTVNDTAVTMDTLMYYIMEQEAEYSYDDTYYLATYGVSYWDMELDDEDTTVRQKIGEYILEVAQLYEVFYQQAQKQGYELTEADIDEAQVNAESIWSTMSDHQKEVTGLTEEALVEIFKKISLATKYYDEVDAGLSIDEDAVTDSIHQDDYKEYTIEMMCLDKTEEDKDGYLVDVSEKDLKKAKSRMETYQATYKKGDSLEDTMQKKEKRMYVREMTFIEGDLQLNAKLEEAAVKLQNDECTEIIELDEGFAFIRMVDNDVTDSYEQAVETAIEDAETAAFDEAYEDIKKDYQIEVRADIWDEISLGNLTIDQDTESVEATEE